MNSHSLFLLRLSNLLGQAAKFRIQAFLTQPKKRTFLNNSQGVYLNFVFFHVHIGHNMLGRCGRRLSRRWIHRATDAGSNMSLTLVPTPPLSK